MSRFKKWYRIGLIIILWIFFLTSIKDNWNDLRMFIGSFIISIIMTLFIIKITK